MIRLILIVIFAIIILFASLIMLPVFWQLASLIRMLRTGKSPLCRVFFKVVLFLSGVTTTVKDLKIS